MPGMRVLIRPAAWIVYVIIVFEILFMLSPFALHFYAAYGPLLNVLHDWPGTAWMTKFYLPHFTATTSPILNALPVIGMLLMVSGLTMFVAGAIPVYWSKFRTGSRGNWRPVRVYSASPIRRPGDHRCGRRTCMAALPRLGHVGPDDLHVRAPSRRGGTTVR